MFCTKEVIRMGTVQEHRNKYIENKEILETLFDPSNKKHCNWIATICFYTALHMVEAKMAKENNFHSHSHREREEMMYDSGLFSMKVLQMYKQLENNSRTARYLPDNIQPTIANQMQVFVKRIEAEVIT